MAGIPAERVRLKRVYDPAADDDGVRVLVERLWPRGIRKAAVDRWERVLDSIELDADVCIARFVRGDDIDTLPAYKPPTDLGPLPAALEPRAQAVLARVREAESMLDRIPRPGIVPRPTRFGTAGDGGTTFTHHA